MEQSGQTVSSNSNISINFLKENNTEFSQNFSKISPKPVVLQMNSQGGMPFILLNTNLCERPIKMFIDTGAAVSIIASDVIDDKIIEENCTLNFFGINENNNSIKTHGMVHSIFSIHETFLNINLHIVDRKYTGSADGYLGLDFLASYKINIDLNKMFLIIKLRNNINSNENDKLNNEPEKGHLKEEIEENFLNILSQSYFEPEKSKKLQKKRKTKCQKNKKVEIKTCQQICTTSSAKILETVKHTVDKSNLENCCVKNNIQSLPNSKFIDMEQYQNSLVCSNVPQEKNINCQEQKYESSQSSLNTLLKKQGSETNYNFETPKVIQIGKMSDSNTSSVHYFEDYG